MGDFHLRLLDVHQHEDHVFSTPFSIVCRLPGRIEPAEYILKGNLKKRVDEAIENNLFPRIVNTSDEISEIRIGSGMLSVSVNSSPNRYSIDVLTYCDDMGISVDQYILNIEGENAALYRDNGFRVVWDPSTYGQLHEKDLKYCYNKTGEWTFDKRAEDLQIPLPYGRECSCRGEIRLCINRTRGLIRFWTGSKRMVE